MSNLSDLLPAGASAKQITATDSGSGIASKAPVVMSASGTVTAVGETSNGNSAATAQLYSSSIVFYQNPLVYDPDTQRIVLVYIQSDSSTYYSYIVVGTSSATGVTWGTPVAIDTSGPCNYINTCYDTTNDRVAIGYNKFGGSNTGGYYAAYSIDGATNTPTEIATKVQYSTSQQSFVALAFDPVQNVIVSASTQSLATKISVARLGASSITLGNEANIPNSSYSNGTINLLYEKNLQKVIANYPDGNNSSRLTTVVITPSGTGTPSIGTEQAWLTDNPAADNTMTFDETSGKLLFTYRRNGSSPTYRGGAKVGLASGTSVTVDATETFFTSTGQAREQSAVYDETAKRICLVYYIHTSGSETRFVDATTSSSDYSVTFGTDAAAYTAITYGAFGAKNLAYDASVGKVVWSFYDQSNNYGYTNMLTLAATTTNVSDFVGVADSAISASAAGSIIVQGGTVTGPTTSVAVAENIGANIPWGDQTKANYTSRAAYGSDDVLIAYSINDGVTVGARVVAGTIGGGTISFGTDAVISADASVSTTRYTVVYDSTNDTYIVSWLDAGDSYKMYAAVVSLTGNSISFGGTTAIVTTANASNFGGTSSVYDPDTQRVIFTYCSTVDLYAYAVVCEVSSTAITTVGTPAKIDSSSANNGYANRVSVCYDTTENKVIATYAYYGGGGTYYLRAAAGTVTGGVSNSITWGSSVPVISGEGTYISSAYNATDQRVVFSYQSATLTGYLNSSVASVSGTTITVGATPSVITTGTNYYSSVAHDATANKMVTYYRGAGGPFVASGAIDTATNTITYSTPTQLLSGTRNFENTLYDPTTGKCILISSGASAGQTSCNIYTTAATLTNQPLTTGTKYFVTPTGAFSSTAGTPSVNAGLAISTTTLLLNGDS